MPLYSNSVPPSAVAKGLDVVIVSAEQLGAGNFSSRAAIGADRNNFDDPITLTFTYATVPSSVEYDIYVAFDDSAGITNYAYTSLKTTNVNGDQVTIQRAAVGGINFRFVCVKEVTSPGVNATVTVRK